jgi:hypothetical protein
VKWNRGLFPFCVSARPLLLLHSAPIMG